MRLIIEDNSDLVAKWAANHIVNRIKEKALVTDRPFVLGLPTGSTPLKTYKELIRMYNEGEVSFKNVITFNMDEYIGLSPEHEQSYHHFMYKHLFSHIDIPRENINLPDGMSSDIMKSCEEYEKKIAEVGGIDLFLGGVGEDGHIAFNEPFSSLTSRTRIKTLTKDTIHVNSRFFGGDTSKVPTTAITVGVGTIMDAKEVMILATGIKKSLAVSMGVESPVSHKWTISAIQNHPHAILVIDEAAAGDLRVNTYRYFKDIEKLNLL